MTTTLDDLVREAQGSGTLSGLPDGHHINGLFVPAASGARMDTVDPGTALSFAQFAAGDADDIELAVRAAQAALGNRRPR
jgi:aldehyde dehydrogenase (NAD+)